MIKKRIIFLNNNSLSVYLGTGNNIAASGEYNIEHLDEFDEYIRNQANVDTHIIVDLIDEEFRRELVPAVNYWDRNKTATRRLNYHFPKSEHKNYFFQWRERTGRKDYHVLLLSLYNTKILNHCLKILQQNNAPLIGIYSLPLLSRHLLSSAKIDHSQVLMVTLQKSSGIRQTFFRNGYLLFSRLSSFTDATDKTLEEIIIQEIEKTKNYLQRMKLILDKKPVKIVIISDESNINKIKSVKPEHLDIEFRDNKNIAAKIKLPHDSHGKYSNFIFVGLFKRLREANHYANLQERSHYYIKRSKHFLQWGSVAISIGLFSMAGLYLTKARQTEQNIESHTQEIRMLRDNKRKTLAALPEAPELLLILSEEKKLQGIVNSGHKLPFSALKEIADTLKDTKGLKLDNISWRNEKSVSTNTDYFPRLPEKRDSIYITIRGSLKANQQDFISVFEKLYTTVDKLKGNANINSVAIQQYPFDAHPQRPISGILANSKSSNTGTFKLTIDYKPKDSNDEVASF